MENDFKIICDAPAKVVYERGKNDFNELVLNRKMEKKECGKRYDPEEICYCTTRQAGKCDYYLDRRGLD